MGMKYQGIDTLNPSPFIREVKILWLIVIFQYTINGIKGRKMYKKFESIS